ncbi:ras-related and estrogen-regulated growth inhibitor-like [Mytilus galloprovincialis]
MSSNGSRFNRGNGSDIKDVCKIAIVGCAGVGKTAITVRYLTKRFIGEYCPTLERIYKCSCKVDDDDVRLEILDTAGQSKDAWKDGYAYWADCFMFVYSITDRQSFDEIIRLKRLVEQVKNSTSVIGILVGNKCDLLHDRQVPANEATELADEIGCQFCEVSAADWTDVASIKNLFKTLVKDLRKTRTVKEGRQRKQSSSVKFKQAIQKVISGKTPAKRTLSA